MTGSDTFGISVTIPAGSSTVEPGAVPAATVTLSWKAFSGAADQAGISREYGGIHFDDGDFEARKAGQDVGLQAWSKAKTYFNGKAVPKPETSQAAPLRYGTSPQPSHSPLHRLEGAGRASSPATRWLIPSSGPLPGDRRPAQRRLHHGS
jgi:hypothetical protein